MISMIEYHYYWIQIG